MNRARYLSNVYRLAPCEAASARARALADTLRDLVLAEYVRLPVNVEWVETDPPGGIERVRGEIEAGTLRVFIGGTPSPLWGPHDNAIFRAVHDWHHFQSGGDFSLDGEVATYRHAVGAYGPGVSPLLFSEIVLQAADAIIHGPGASPQRVVLFSGPKAGPVGEIARYVALSGHG